MKTITVNVRLVGAGYTARAGRGKKAKVASRTSDPQSAARAAAAKFFHLDACNVQTEDDIQLSGSYSFPHGGTYTATLPDLPETKGGA